MQIATGIAVSLLAAAGARADGDPASDVLPAADVFLPYPAPHKDVAAALEKLVASANTGGNRLKVAVVASRIDLGAIPSRMRSTTTAAKRLSPCGSSAGRPPACRCGR